MSDSNTLTIGQVAKRANLNASTLRYYEEKGLIKSSGRRGLTRLFQESVLDQLAVIALGRHAGFSLDEVGEMFGADGKPQLDRIALMDKADELDRSIKKLTTMRDGLRHAANCSAPDHLECPTFLRLMNIATKRKVT
ncbi:MerR family transcriptional regulator [Leucothrix arctica]|uniref:MerR family transcriptional regulator n=1 Tax=Leucothrix arctica TaxID=1481894 RepID=A0A317C861_9GAMM|nr:helix-turn-helix domain-containing protein [Leucothrix arctica]PWQ94806.1 MerR family transcriptional regulator [Leucothrix arctica]